jgi:hypothetical protein
MRTSTGCSTSAPTGHTIRLEDPQELGLRGQRQLADLVEEQRAAVGRGEATDAVVDRAGERALQVAEQLGLDQAVGDRRAVDRDERPGVALRGAVDGAREQLLAGAGLAGDEDGGRGRTNPPREVESRGELRGAAEDVGGIRRAPAIQFNGHDPKP